MRTMWILGMRRPYKRTSQALRDADAGRNEIAPVGIPTPHVDKTNEAIQETHSIYSVTSSRVVLEQHDSCPDIVRMAASKQAMLAWCGVWRQRKGTVQVQVNTDPLQADPLTAAAQRR
eukprot:scaffold1542_cov143-Skeletonema_marinoi.AAC.10